jgi:hypothetical protein
MCGEASTAEVESWALTIREVCSWHFRDEMFKAAAVRASSRGVFRGHRDELSDSLLG